MVGGGSRREEAPVINSSNVFATLGSLKKKKKKPEILRRNRLHPRGEPPREKGGFLAPAPLTSKSWADVDDEDDDDYYAITAPPQSVWGAPVAAAAESEAHAEAEDEHENDLEAPIEPETVVKKPREPSLSTKETEEQLSKKELKKKELEELEAVLAELGLQKEPGSQADSHGLNLFMQTFANTFASPAKMTDYIEISYLESFTCPGRKKTTTETAGTGKAEDAPVTDVKEWHKKVASVKKKKSSKEMDAAARSARLAVAKFANFNRKENK
ncbi:hypothetical protein AAHE18_01G195400 [Arachis hypogaea]